MLALIDSSRENDNIYSYYEDFMNNYMPSKINQIVQERAAAKKAELDSRDAKNTEYMGIIAGINYQWPGLGDQLSPVVWGVIALVAGWVGGYMTKNVADPVVVMSSTPVEVSSDTPIQVVSETPVTVSKT